MELSISKMKTNEGGSSGTIRMKQYYGICEIRSKMRSQESIPSRNLPTEFLGSKGSCIVKFKQDSHYHIIRRGYTEGVLCISFHFQISQEKQRGIIISQL